MRHALPAAFVLLALPGAAFAATLGLPILTTAPATISVVDNFVGNAPSGLISVSVSSTIQSAEGAPDLVGQDVAFSFTGFLGGGGFVGDLEGFSIGASGNIALDGILDAGRFLIFPPFTEAFDPVTDLVTSTYDDPFGAFGGPFVAPFPGPDIPAVELHFALDQPLPTKIFRAYCLVSDPGDCTAVEDDGDVPLTQIDGEAVFVDYEDVYNDGPIAGGTVTFSTVGGPPPSPVPLPAGLWLLGGALGGLAALRRATRRVD